ncbi:CmpA/NrtA family ABC transporter substrate-binding protein [Hirschia maritima]|uniref:CmpA/NrtA family ABC transporter substrate-binding protein n=1 Tax=Hirschia maritima TaxID=1121961 RepID=UPI000369ACFD|nr:CmpA/NrtA family ABC transporter substrate-binding protein [Hirschia maritima]
MQLLFNSNYTNENSLFTHWKKPIGTLVGATAALMLAACGGSNETSSSSTKPTESVDVSIPALELEKTDLTFGFIKLTDMAPLAIAYEKGYFEDEGLFVTIEPQANWKVLLDRVIDGELDGAHMLAGQPIAATIGYGTKADIITPFSMDLNGNGITVSNEVWAEMKPNLPKMDDGRPVHPIKAEYLKPVVEKYTEEGKPFNMGMVFPVSTHNYELRYWLASGGIHPGYYSPDDVSGQIQAEAFLSVTPPPQMPATLEAGTIYGYCVGEPWNQQAVFKGIGVPVITDYEIWKDNPEKVFGITKQFAEENPNTTLALTKALIRAAMWLDENDNANRPEAVEILSRSEYVGADYEVIANSMTGTFEYEKGDKRDVPDFNVFFRYNATYPYYSDAVWYLTQMRRWGQIPEGKSDEWYDETAKSVYRPDIYLEAAKMLVDEGKANKADFPWETDGYKAPTPAADIIDGIGYDGRTPNAYLDSLTIGLKGSQKIVDAKVTE